MAEANWAITVWEIAEKFSNGRNSIMNAHSRQTQQLEEPISEHEVDVI